MNIFGDFYDGLPGDHGHRFLREYNESKEEFVTSEIPAKSKLPDESKKVRLPWLYLILFLVIGRLLFGLFTIQVTESGQNSLLAEHNRSQTVVLNPTRGIFLDAKGQPLVKNAPMFSLGLLPADLPKNKKEKEALFLEIAARTEVPIEEIVAADKKGVVTLDPVILKDDLSRDQALILEEKLMGLRGVAVIQTPYREYDKTPGLAHILGYVGRMSEADIAANKEYLPSDFIGKNGLEKSYEKELRGVPGRRHVEVNSRGEAERVLDTLEPESGANILLYLDKELVQKTADALKRGIEKSAGKSGAAVIMDPRNGGILASVSWPTYDNNLFAKGIKKQDYEALSNDKLLPMLDRVAYGQYPSGSTIKPFIAAAALEEKVVSDNFRLNTPPEIEVGQWKFLDWKPHGSADIRQAIAESNNIFFYALGGGYEKVSGLGVDRINEYLARFGFGAATGVDLPGESKGLVPSPEWKEKTKQENWYIGDTYNLSIGQGDLLVTPLQLVRGVSAIANGGKLFAPRYAKEIVDANRHKIADLSPKLERENIVSAEALKVVREGMRRAVESGTARPLQSVAVPVAAKTGTAQFSNVEKEKTHAWTVAFAPYENPELAIAVVVDGGGESFEVAIPIVKEILEQRFGKK